MHRSEAQSRRILSQYNRRKLHPPNEIVPENGPTEPPAQIALHGTFLVDRERLCRWHDVSFEPFMDVDFLPAESKRLLSRPVAPVAPGTRVISD
jgi:hypothetical protein